ncbi:hypothetical protein SAMN04488074_11787 [Lentzea albidocapillata subsp. violacea]|uniref:FXSXX-COOH protein n=1 Tax=Lentzea albidocapillata subsp. violacea TaxID=128104 RepID=A0A1G9QWC0_9PSEU|nr:hypothetical protein [Lentzea albidocapillata]SDM15316.1 hypothetical protein SAMN04488074_11787 [Lentzea albidocapillata subsp. violacea]
MEEAPEVNCALVDLTGICLDELRHTTDGSVAASVRAVLLDVADPDARAARMNDSGGNNDCVGSRVPERRGKRKPVPLITC